MINIKEGIAESISSYVHDALMTARGEKYGKQYKLWHEIPEWQKMNTIEDVKYRIDNPSGKLPIINSSLIRENCPRGHVYVKPSSDSDNKEIVKDYVENEEYCWMDEKFDELVFMLVGKGV